MSNFLKTIRGEAKPKIEVGQTSTLLCHLGNIDGIVRGQERGNAQTNPRAQAVTRKNV